MAQVPQSYFRFLPFAPTDVACLALPEILAEKIRACYQRNKVRDIFDLGMFVTRPLDHAMIRSLVILNSGRLGIPSIPRASCGNLKMGAKTFDWDDLQQLTNRAITIDRDQITRACEDRERAYHTPTRKTLAQPQDGFRGGQVLRDRREALLA